MWDGGEGVNMKTADFLLKYLSNLFESHITNQKYIHYLSKCIAAIG